jgi:hypothetical protein
MWAILILLAGMAHADDLVLEVPADIDAVVLDCPGQRLEQPVPASSGPTASVRFPMWPGRECAVEFRRSVGRVVQLGSWRCAETGCVEVGSDEAPAPPLPPGQIKVLVAEGLPHPTVELTCPGGFRQRAAVMEHAALFTGVPDEDCDLFFKGGAPLRYRPLRYGTWACSVVANTAVCRPR